MVRSFRYRVEPSEIKEHLRSSGYETDETYWPDGEASGFRIRNTNLKLSYDNITRHPVTGDLITVGFGMISLNNNPYSPSYLPERAEASLKLYHKLYRRFRKQYERSTHQRD